MDWILETANDINHINKNPYFVRLQNAQPENFLISQECFISAIDNWSKILGLLLASLPSDKERVVIIKNLSDEHGNGNLDESHVNTFRLFLKSLGYNKEISIYNNNLKSYHYIESFNDSLTDELKNSNWISNVAMIGMIEYVYTDASTNIHNYVKKYLAEDQIYHYNLHEIVDVKHANELFELLVPLIGSNKNDIIHGFYCGYTFMNNLYTNLAQYLELIGLNI